MVLNCLYLKHNFSLNSYRSKDLDSSNLLFLFNLTFNRKENEVQLMMNRIALLELEEEKIKKKIDLTKKKA